MDQLIPVGIFELFIFRSATDPEKYAIQIVTPAELQDNLRVWMEAAGCLTSFAARHSTLGYEKTLDIVQERAMRYRDTPTFQPPQPPANPESPEPPILA